MPFKNPFRRKPKAAALPLSAEARAKRKKRRVFLAAVAVAAGIGVGERLLRRKPTTPVPPSVTAHELITHIGGKRWNEQLSPRQREYWAKEWAEAFAPKSDPRDRLPGFEKANRQLITALSEAQLEYNFVNGLAGEKILHPRTVRRFIGDVRALAEYSTRAGGSKYFFLNRNLERTWNAHDRATVEYFKLLHQMHPSAVEEIYSAVGLK